MIKICILYQSERIDKFLAQQFPRYSRSYFQFLINNHHIITSDGRPLKKRDLLQPKTQLNIRFVPTEPLPLTAENIPLDILYEDDDILCINKPTGMVTHPAPGHPSGTFAHALLYHCKTLLIENNDQRPGIVHRLDKDTSGVLIAAKNRLTHQRLIQSFSTRTIKKHYLAITIGLPKNSVIELPIGRHPIKRKEMTTLSEGKSASTHLKILAHHRNLALVQASPITGRTHQIRVHLRSENTPILGDPIYGCPKLNQSHGISRTLLHAQSIHFLHPITLKPLSITAPLPKDFKKHHDLIKNLD